jgi:hypothetical protein
MHAIVQGVTRGLLRVTTTLESLLNEALKALHIGEYERAEKLLSEAWEQVDLQGPQRASEMAYLYLLLADALESQNRDASSVRAFGELLRSCD